MFNTKFILSKTIIITTFLISCLLIFLHFYFISFGFYFTGDTLSYFEPAFPGRKGDLLSVFLWSYSSWPPGVPIIFHLLRFLPISFISQHQVYVFLISLFSLIITYLIARKITDQKLVQIILIALVLFTGVQSFLLKTALSEPLLIFFCLATTLCLERFVSTQKERFLMLVILFGSFIPLSKYTGAWILLGFNLALIGFVYLFWQQKKISPSLVLISVILSWVPILIYLLRNYLLSPNIFGGIDTSIDPALRRLDGALLSFLPTVLNDMKLLFLGGLILGINIKWGKPLENYLILSFFSTAVFYTGFAYALTRYRGSSAFHSRYIAVAYPELILLAICLGSYLASKFLRFKKFNANSLIILVLILANQLFLSIKNLNQEVKSSQSIIEGAEHSADIRSLCLGKTPNKYLFLQESSRNWTGQSLGFYCQPISFIPFNTDSYKIPAKSYLFTPYRLNNEGLDVFKIYKGDKEINVYMTSNPIVINIREELQRQISLDWLSGAR